MSEEISQESPNPYQAPEAKNLVVEEEGQGYLESLEFKKLEKLYYRSHNVSSIAGLMILGLVLICGVTVAANESANFGFLGFIILFYGATITGLIMRSSWGRILCIIACILMVFGGIFGIIVGIMGLFACFGAPQLFGPDRITHAELKAVYKKRKKERKMKR